MIEKIKDKWYFIVIGILSICVIASSYFAYTMYECCQNKNNEEEVLAINTNEESEVVESKNIEKTFFVEVKGYVKKPGVYEIKDGMIINDVIKMSGNFKSNAYTNNINLSKKLNAEMVIYVYSKTEYSKLNEKIIEVKETCNCKEYDIKECIDNGSSVINVGETNENNNNNLVNINTASKEELLTISGIGDSKASKIIEYRELNGLFSTIEDIMNVSGIGESIFNTIKESITV